MRIFNPAATDLNSRPACFHPSLSLNLFLFSCWDTGGSLVVVVVLVVGTWDLRRDSHLCLARREMKAMSSQTLLEALCRPQRLVPRLGAMLAQEQQMTKLKTCIFIFSQAPQASFHYLRHEVLAPRRVVSVHASPSGKLVPYTQAPLASWSQYCCCCTGPSRKEVAAPPAPNVSTPPAPPPL